MQSLSWAQAVDHVVNGGILVYPTDTVWGLGCRADDRPLVLRCLGLKGPARTTIASVITPLENLEALVYVHPESHWQAFLPGPYTLILPLKDRRFEHLAGPGPTLGCRVPDLPPLVDMVGRTGVPLVTTSCNPHGQAPAQTLAEARRWAEFWDAGLVCHETTCSSASTVLKWNTTSWTCLRRGAGPFPLPESGKNG